MKGTAPTNRPRNEAQRNRRDLAVAVALVSCVVLVGFWELMAARSRSSFKPFKLNAAAMAGFLPADRDWQVRPVAVPRDPQEPNILAYRVVRRAADTSERACPVFLRLVHGYNMRDCMRLKDYTVDLLSEASASGSVPRLQRWRLTSSTGDVAIWITSMLRAEDFAATDLDVRSIPFPRVDSVVDPGWSPQGITREGLRHPVRGLRRYLRAGWNASRCDWATFLGLRPPAWASEDLLTLVSASVGASVSREAEEAVGHQVAEAHRMLITQLQQWRASHPLAEAAATVGGRTE